MGVWVGCGRLVAAAWLAVVWVGVALLAQPLISRPAIRMKLKIKLRFFILFLAPVFRFGSGILVILGGDANRRFSPWVNIPMNEKPLSFGQGRCHRLERISRGWSMHVSVSLPRGNRKSGDEAVELALWMIQITVARQRRTLTGFAIKPSHPGERRLIPIHIQL